jgi:Zn-dependent protease with chaperone function
MPIGLLAGLPPGQIEAILVHELAHIRRHDFLVNVLQRSVEGLCFITLPI